MVVLGKQDVRDYIERARSTFLTDLVSLLAIPSISTDTQYKDQVRACAEWVAEDLRRIGFPRVELFETKGHPIVFGEWVVNSKLPTVLIYGHYDVQPLDPLNKWITHPFRPDIRDGYVYARGACDSKGNFFTFFKAMEVFSRLADGPPVNIKVFLEGNEETGGQSTEEFVRQNRGLLVADYVISSDAGIYSTVIPCMDIGMRGIVYYEVTFRTASEDLHSGVFGGPVPNPLELISRFISGIKSPAGRIEIPGFYQRVRVFDPNLLELINSRLLSEEEFISRTGIPCLVGEPLYSFKERMSVRPTFEVHGIRGGYTGVGSKTVLPAEGSVKVSLRLVPDQDPDEIGKLFEEYTRRFFSDYRIDPNIVRLSQGGWWISDCKHSLYGVASQALKEAFDAPKTGFVFCGASIPVVPVFEKVLGVPILMFGFGLEDDGFHAPNERLGLDRFLKGIEAVVYLLQGMAEMDVQK